LSSEPVLARGEAAHSAEAADLVIVSDPADEVARELQAYVADTDRTAVILDVFDAAQAFTIIVRAGEAVVEPEVPMFLRFPAMPAQRLSFDAEFHVGECVAQIWAAAALSRAPVINRPAAALAGGRTSPSAAVTESRAGLSGTAGGGIEVFSSQYPEPVPGDGERFWVEDLGTLRTRAWPQRPGGSGPYRARWSDGDPVMEIVVVLGDRAWRCTTADIDHLDLERQSIAAAAALGLTLAAFTWRVTGEGASARLVNVDPHPALEPLRMVWLGLGPRLLEVLFP
jgi:hypothetical protein